MPLNRSDLPADVMTLLAQGTVIPAHPLALDSQRQFDRRRQRSLTRYYVDAGVGGLAVGGQPAGGVHLPRIGQDVLVDPIGGDMDLPVCTGRVHNQSNLPPWSLPEQSALSGFRSRELTEEGARSA